LLKKFINQQKLEKSTTSRFLRSNIIKQRKDNGGLLQNIVRFVTKSRSGVRIVAELVMSQRCSWPTTLVISRQVWHWRQLLSLAGRLPVIQARPHRRNRGSRNSLQFH